MDDTYAFKRVPKNDAKSYRGITSLCTFAKILEIMIYDVLVMSCINYISVDQHGFVPKRSVTTNLAQFVSECHTSFESEYQMDTVYTDFQAAFDSINHNILLAKLAPLGISPLVIDWLKSYLTDRMYSVRIDNIFSQHRLLLQTELLYSFRISNNVARGPA